MAVAWQFECKGTAKVMELCQLDQEAMVPTWMKAMTSFKLCTYHN